MNIQIPYKVKILIVISSQDLDPKKICFQLEDGSFEYREGILGNCGGPCCIFYGEAPAQ